MEDIGTCTATCGSCDWSTNGYKIRCDDIAPYRAEFRCELHDDCGSVGDYSIPVCARHAAHARALDSLKRIYGT